MSDFKIKDSGMAIFVAGSVATIFQLIFSWSLYLLGIVEQNPSILHTRLLTNQLHYATWDLVLGTLTNYATGVFFMGFVWLVLKVFGGDYAVFKGAFVGFINAMMQFLFFARLFSNPTKLIPNTATLWHVFIGYTIWGAIGAYLLTKYYDVKPFGN